MKNHWLKLRNQRKVFEIGDVVTWDRSHLGQELYDYMVSEYGTYFDVMSKPYDTISPVNGQFYSRVIDIGRLQEVILSTIADNIIDFTL